VPTFITIGYGDQAGYDRTAAESLAAAHAHDAELLAKGALIGRAGPAVQVRNHAGRGVQTTAGPFVNPALPVAGFMLIDAGSLEEAVELVAGSPCAVADGVVEVWPLLTS
jgi:hypothetical protein